MPWEAERVHEGLRGARCIISRVVSGNSVEVEWTCSEGNVLDGREYGLGE